jgi:hypothetical protein
VDEAADGAGDQVRLPRQQLLGAHPQTQHVAVDGAQRDLDGGGRAADPAVAQARGEDRAVGGEDAPVGQREAHPLALRAGGGDASGHEPGGGSGADRERAAVGSGLGAQGGDAGGGEPSRVHLMVVRGVEAGGQARGQGGLGAAQRADGDGLDPATEDRGVLEHVVPGAGVRGVRGHDPGALREEARLDVGEGGEQVHEGRVGLPAGLQQRGEVVLAELGLGERREHPRRGVGGPGHGVRAPGGVQLGGDQGDGVACGAQTHGGGEADDPGPDDGHVHGPVLLTAA